MFDPCRRGARRARQRCASVARSRSTPARSGWVGSASEDPLRRQRRGDGSRHALGGGHRRAAGRARRPRDGIRRRVPLPRRPARPRERDLRAVVRDGAGRDPPLGLGHAHDRGAASRAARQRSTLAGGGARVAAGRGGDRLRAALGHLRAVGARAARVRRQHPHDRPLPPRRRDPRGRARGLPARARRDARDGPDGRRLRHHHVLPAAAAAGADRPGAADRPARRSSRRGRCAASTCSSTRAAATR